MESFLNHPPLEAMENPITMKNVQQHQFIDLELSEIRRLRLELYPVKYIEGRPPHMHKNHRNEPE
eukprot:14192395-Ditylum_brightwellii.AAC.1